MTLSPAENARLLGHVPHLLPWAGLSTWERNFLIGVRGRHKRNPALVLKPNEVRWLEPIVARFLRETLGEGRTTTRNKVARHADAAWYQDTTRRQRAVWPRDATRNRGRGTDRSETMAQEAKRGGPGGDLLHSIAENIRLHDKERAEQAVGYILEHASVTYEQAAARYNVGVQQVRGRIISRWGSLSAARTMSQGQREEAHRVTAKVIIGWRRPCMVCQGTELRPRGQYVCDPCASRRGAVHDGAV